jgi:hypothetical protein
MLIEVQIPFADLRRFVGEDTARLSRPQWPYPTPSEFVRHTGAVRRRGRGPVSGLGDEAWVCDTSRLIRVPRQVIVPIGSGVHDYLQLRCVFQRLLFDGRAVGRFSFGFVASEHLYKPLNIAELAMRAVLTTPLKLRFVADALPLITTGSSLASAYVRSTSKAGAATLRDWWVRTGSPVVLVESSGTPESVWTMPLVKDPPGFAIYGGQAAAGDDTARLWAVVYQLVSRPRDRRNWRLHLVRLHAEHEVLKCVIAAILSGTLSVGRGDDTLQAYLTRAERWHTRTATSGVASAELLKATGQAFDLVAPSDRQALLEAIAEIRPQLVSKLAALTSVTCNNTTELKHIYIETREAAIAMGDDRSQRIDTKGGDIGNILGADSHIGRDVVGRDRAASGVPKPNTRSAGATYASLAIAILVAIIFTILGIVHVLEWKYAVPAALGGGVVIAAGSMLASHFRG